MQIAYKDTIIDVKEGTKVSDLFKEEIRKSNNEIIACRFNNEIKGLNYKLKSSGTIELVDITEKDGMRVYQRGLIYVVAKAFHDIYPEALITINYQLYHSMFCEVDNLNLTQEMIKKVNKRVKEIIESDLPIERKSMSKEDAKTFYEQEKSLKGRLQLDLETKEQVTLYYCEDYYNYFYGVMPISTGCVKQYELLKYHDGFLIRYPSRKNPYELGKFIESPKLFETLDEYDNLHKTLNINTLYKLNQIIKKDEIRDYILMDEALHEKKIAKIADSISSNKEIKVVLIAGPSSSGKTTFAKRLEIELRLNGLKTKTISVDNYFVERKDNPRDENGEYDFEAIEAIDTKLLNNDLLKLLNGEEINAPTFNFHIGTKEYLGNTMKLEEDEILIMEGIHCLNDELTFLIPKEKKFKIYISCLTVLNIDYYNRISTTDTRLIRRIVRDNQFRGYDALHTLKMWPSVNRGEAKNIFPYQEQADVMFNSSLIYELSVLKDYAMPLLAEIKSDIPEFSEAKRLYTMLSYFESIPTKTLPSNSLLREFVGGSIFE
ncbi:MAG: nucleoside kinase [Clostridia bacterium]|nr:nucleoside kinase [Clostridia bacterium]